MSDARWFEVNSEIEAAIRHFGRSAELYRRGGFDAPGLDGYQAAMALMHSLQSAPLEGGFQKRRLLPLRLATISVGAG